MVEQLLNAFMASDFARYFFPFFNALIEFLYPSNAPAAYDMPISGVPTIN